MLEQEYLHISLHCVLNISASDAADDEVVGLR